jgi:hypothetical protein
MTSRVRPGALVPALVLIALSRSASAHDPLEATAVVRLESDRLEIAATLGARRAFRACRSEPFEACARHLYLVASDGSARPGDGPLRLTAAHLQRNPDEMAGATLTVFAGGKLLRRQILDAENASVEVQVEVGAPPAARFAAAVPSAIVVAAAIGLAVASYRRRRAGAR